MTLSFEQLLDPWEGEVLFQDDLVKRLVLAAAGNDVYIRSWVATHPSTPKSVLVMLAHDESELVRAQLTRNESCPREVVAILALDRSEVVLRAVLNSCKIPANIAHDWMKSQDWTKRAAVAGWKNLSLAEAEELARDEDPRVRYAIQANYHWPKFSRDVIMSKSFEDITRDEVDAAILALHDADVYLKLALVPDREARLLLVKEARNWWHIPDQVVELLSRDADAEVKWEAEQVFSYRESSRNKNIQ